MARFSPTAHHHMSGGLGFDYRGSYSAFGIDRTQLTGTLHRLPVERGLEPFERFLHLRQGGVNAPSNPATPTKGKTS